MESRDLRQRYIRFFAERGHVEIPPASLLPENDPTVLFTTAGMHPLVPFLLGEPHPQGKRLVNFQKCIRTNDIEEVGDLTHLTFFEMLGNWSLGDYFKEEALAWSHEFLTRELKIDPARLAVTVFAGDSDAPRDEVAAGMWHKLGVPNERIFFLPKVDNWWGPAGASGPCGPDSEIFYDTGRPDHPGCRPGCPCGKWFEIWNNVFMEYEKRPDGRYGLLQQRNVDTGMGIERTVACLQGWDDIFRVETIYPLIVELEHQTGRSYSENPRPFRIIADHLRAATFAIGDGAYPANVEAGYVTRRLVRRAVRTGRELGIHDDFCARMSGLVVDLLSDVYPSLTGQRQAIAAVLADEEVKFKGSLERGLVQAQKVIRAARQENRGFVSGAEAFNLFETYGFPLELTREIAAETGLRIDEKGYMLQYEQHKEDSRRQTERFKGGLADHAEETTRLHTASHLLQAALRRVLGDHVHQMGSNITVERLRFDFSHDQRLTDEQLAQVSDLVNQQIRADLPVTVEIMTLETARQAGALAFFGDKYGDQVKVYSIGEFSKEVCGGPHVEHTGELGQFKILKQEAVGKGIRRIRAALGLKSCQDHPK